MSTLVSDTKHTSTIAGAPAGRQISEPSAAEASAPGKDAEPTELTWAVVQSGFIAALKAEGKGPQKKNFKTAIKFWLEAIGKTETSLVGEELTEEFEASLEIYVKFQKKRGCKKGTYGPRLSKIKAIKQFVVENFASSLAFQTLPKAFGQRIRKLITCLGFTIKGFWRTLPEGLLKYCTLLNWCLGRKLPSIKFLTVISTIENHLNVPKGTLRLPQYLLRGHDLLIGQSDSGNKIRAALSKPYYQWTESLEEEFQGLFINKTVAILPDGEERSDGGQWTSDENGKIPSSIIVRETFRSFMGFCALPKDNPDPYLRGAGIKLEDLTLALIADQHLVENYLHFRRLRSGLRVKPCDASKSASLPSHKISADGVWEYYDMGGKYNNGSVLVLAIVSSLLRPGTGYLYQHVEYAEKLGPRMTAPTWKEQCIKARKRVDVIRKQILKMRRSGDIQNFDFGRDPKERIQWILDLPRPFFILHEMLKDMLDDLLPESAPKLARARQFRDLILFALLCANPLRIHMYSTMKFDKNLIRRSDGSWWISFNKSAFKNRRALPGNYLVPVAEELWPMLNRYRCEFHPVLAGSTGSEYVFVRIGKGRHGKQAGVPMSGSSLSEVIQQLTELYIPGMMGFRPHAFRHIIATDIIKKNPRFGFILASIALHDRYETVKAEYVHLKTSEFFEPVNTHFREAWSSVFGPSQELRA